MTDVSLKRRHSAVFDSSPLFRLPFELLEEISFFFTRFEAVKLLTVSGTFHEVFAGRIWRHPTSTDHRVWKAPASAWTRYGHLIRNLFVPNDASAEVCMPHLSKLVKLDVDLGEMNSEIFKHEMPLLQKLSLRCLESTAYQDTDVIAAAMKWISKAEQNRSQIVSIEWQIDVSSDDNTSWIDNLLQMISNTEQHSISLSVTDGLELEENNAIKLASMLREFSHEGKISLDEDEMNVIFGSFLDDSRLVYSKLQSLGFDLAVYESIEGKSGSSVSKLCGTQFPVLKSVSFSSINDGEYSIDDSMFTGVFENVKTMRISHCDRMVWKFNTGAFPQLQSLEIQESEMELDIPTLAQQMPHLQQLSVGENSSIYFTYTGSGSSGIRDTDMDHASQLVNLRSLEWDLDAGNNYFDIGDLDLIFENAPNLDSVDVRLRFVEWDAWDIDVDIDDDDDDSSEDDNMTYNGVTNESVRYFNISFWGSAISKSNLFALVGRFPNLEHLHYTRISADDEDENMAEDALFDKLSEKYPHLQIKRTLE